MLIRSKNKMHIVNIENGVVSAEGDGTLTFRAGKAAANFALVDKKYRIIPEDIKLSRNLDITLLLEWDRVRKKILQTAGGKNES